MHPAFSPFGKVYVPVLDPGSEPHTGNGEKTSVQGGIAPRFFNEGLRDIIKTKGPICSLLNKLFDLAPPILIGLAVDVVLLKEQSVLAGFGLRTAGQQLWGLALLTFVIWAAESLFEYLYDVLWRNLAQTTQHSLRLEAYDHLQKLELSFFEQDSTGRLMAVLNDDINQLERFLDRGANQILQLITTVLVVGIGMAMVAPEVALFAYLPIPVILWGSLHFQRQLAPRYQEVRARVGDLSSRLANNLGGMLTIKSFTAEGLELERLLA